MHIAWRTGVRLLVLSGTGFLNACSGGADASNDDDGAGSGGETSASGGEASASGGKASGTGGAHATSGGSGGSATGGVASGGAEATGGSVATGGAIATGGVESTGGAVGTGGGGGTDPECVPGQHVFVDGSTVTCIACEEGSFADQTNQEACTAHSICDVGTAQASPGTLSTDTVCEPCTAGSYCPGGDTADIECSASTWDDDANPTTPCVARRICEPGQFVVSDGSAVLERTCADCDEGWFSADANAVACEKWLDCPKGSFVVSDPTEAANRVCATCAEGYSTEGNAVSCTPWSDCTSGFRVNDAGTNLADRICSPCPASTTTTASNQSECVPDGAPGACQVTALTPGTSLCRGAATLLTWTTQANMALYGARGGLEKAAGANAWTNLATATSVAADEDFCIAYQGVVNEGYNQLMAGIRTTTPFSGQYLDRGVYFDALGPCYFFEGMDNWNTHACNVKAPSVYTPTGGDCVLIEVERRAGTLRVALDGEVLTTETLTGAATPTVLLYNDVAKLRAAYRY